MSTKVCATAMLKCSFGMAPSVLNVLPVNRVCCNSVLPAANIMDNKPFLNILPFGMCSSPANPMVAAATVAALGVLTPMPCIPVTVAPWIPGAVRTLTGSMPALTKDSMLMCNWAGVITVSSPGEFTVDCS